MTTSENARWSCFKYKHCTNKFVQLKTLNEKPLFLFFQSFAVLVLLLYSKIRL